VGACLADTVKARYLQADGEYRPIGSAASAKDAPVFSSQDFLIRVAEGKANARQIPAAVTISLEDVQAETAPAPAAKKKSAPKKSAKKAATSAMKPVTGSGAANGAIRREEPGDEELDPAESTLR